MGQPKITYLKENDRRAETRSPRRTMPKNKRNEKTQTLD